VINTALKFAIVNGFKKDTLLIQATIATLRAVTSDVGGLVNSIFKN
jgi:hypothetical protein